MEKSARELLLEGGVEPEHLDRLAQYAALVLDAKQRFNLTGARTLKEFIPHILDSLTVAPYASDPYIDVGSGAGLPGIPLAVVSGLRPALVEATGKKAAFLKRSAASLGLDCRVVQGRAEDAARNHELREQFASATARAVASAPAALELIAAFLRVGGVAILQRGPEEAGERRALDDAAPILGCSLDREVLLTAERRVLLIRKVAPTPARFPRRSGIPSKRPLCS